MKIPDFRQEAKRVFRAKKVNRGCKVFKAKREIKAIPVQKVLTVQTENPPIKYGCRSEIPELKRIS